MKYDDNIREEAATWFAALRRGPMALEERADFDRWRADSANQAALNSMHELWGEIASLRQFDIVPKPQVKERPPRIWAAAAAVLLAVGSGLWLTNPFGGSHVTTAIGEQATRTMPDGSVITVNVATKLAYDMESDKRTVDMREGEAVFFVRKDKTRPFLVRAGDYEVRAVGTAFNVRNRDGAIDVAVIEGVVAIKALTGPRAGQEIARLEAGHRIALVEAKSPGSFLQQAVSTQSIAEWRLRTLDYEDVPISRVVADLNLFFDRPIAIADPALANRRVTLRLQVDDRERALELLAALLNLDISRRPGNDALLEKVPAT